MNFAKILAQLREELRNVDAAIQTLERLQQSAHRRSRSGAESDPPSQEALPATSKNAPTARTNPSRKTRRNDPRQT
jgi:hypothetical protein